MVNQVSNKNRKFGFLTETIKFMYSYPDLFKRSVKEVNVLPGTFVPAPLNFEPINKLEKDLIVLSTYSDTSDSRTIVLLNLKNDSILRKWTFKNQNGQYARIVNPILHPDGTLIYNYYYTKYPGLFKIDSAGEILWQSDTLLIHHGMNLNKDGDIWACTQIPGWRATGKYFLGGVEVFYNDYTITKFENETGEILFHKSITELLAENNLANYIFKSADTKEPIHLNDVQPALKTTKYFKEDDVFISLRNVHLILHYRPSTNELINVLEGPFINQHDVDILNDSTLVIFNNNTYADISREGKKPHDHLDRPVNAGEFFCNIISYDLKNKSYSVIGENVFKENEIFTMNEGLMEFLTPDTYFVEEQNPGILWVIKGDEVIYKNVIKSQHKGHHHLPNWTRIVKYE